MVEMAEAGSARRARLIEDHLAAAAALGELHLEPRDYFGDLACADPVRCGTWRGYLVARAAKSLTHPWFASVDAAALAADLPDCRQAAFVHLDAFAGNMLTDGRRVTAVLDFGPTAVAGDRRLDPVASAVYLTAPDITPFVTPRDVQVVHAWLRSAGLHDLFEPARRWLAAFWAFAADDPKVSTWCRSVLLR
jgi:aminoglycoside phosphotransferase (APT) family kinase protein